MADLIQNGHRTVEKALRAMLTLGLAVVKLSVFCTTVQAGHPGGPTPLQDNLAHYVLGGHGFTE